MLRTIGVLALSLSLVPALHAATSPFSGRWDFNVTQQNGRQGAVWLGVTEKGSGLDLWYQPTGGHVELVPDYKVSGTHLTFNMKPNITVELDAKGGKLVGTQKRGDQTVEITGVKAPELKGHEPKAWTTPVAIFNGKDLSGWTPIGNVAANHWTVQDGDLYNAEKGANLKSDGKYSDFKVHFEVSCPDNANSGFYLRGRYEMQLEHVRAGTEPVERSMGSIYGRLAPIAMEARKPGEWETFDITLVGRTVTIVRDGVTTIDHKDIDGITGGALDANEGEPGSFYIQGDHTGGLKFRNITVSVPKK